MKNLNWITDYLFICSADSVIQVRAIVDSIIENFNHRLRSLAGYQEGRWVLMDYGDVMVHVFHQAARNFYNLERLWADAHREKTSVKCPKKRRP